jgi:hypothetical protein
MIPPRILWCVSRREKFASDWHSTTRKSPIRPSCASNCRSGLIVRSLLPLAARLLPYCPYQRLRPLRSRFAVGTIGQLKASEAWSRQAYWCYVRLWPD